MQGNGLTADDLLWNWARWSWSGETVGNMAAHIPWDDDSREIHFDHANAVDRLHKQLPWHERMIVIAEYTQKNSRFAGMDTRQRREKARRWIEETTGVHLTDTQYKLYLGLFKNTIARKLL